MRAFKSFPESSTCPICGTSEDKECVLIGKSGTEEGNIMEARCYHMDCIELVEYIDGGDIVIAQKFKVI